MPWENKRLWELQPARDFFFGGCILTVLVLCYWLRAVTVPALFALVLAYVFDPVVRAARDRFHFPRTLTTSLCVSLIVFTIVGLLAYLIPQVISDGQQVLKTAPKQLAELEKWLQSKDLIDSSLQTSFDAKQFSAPDQVFKHATNAMGVAGQFFGGMAYLLLAGIFFLACFAYFSIRLPHLPRLWRFFPAAHRTRVRRIMQSFARAFGGFLRGQCFVAVFTTASYAFGFLLIGVPQALLAATIGGVMSFIPNGQAAGMLAAWLFGLIDSGGGFDPLKVFVYPAGVFAISQSMETFVVTPWVQGAQTKLHPLLVFAALIAGGSMGGLLGIFLAIPLAACARVLIMETKDGWKSWADGDRRAVAGRSVESAASGAAASGK